MRTAEATAAPARSNPMTALGGGEEVKQPPLVTFDAQGQQEEGFLVDYVTGEIDGYIFERENGDRFRVNVTADLKQKIRMDLHTQHYVIVTFRGVDVSVTKNGNSMRDFKVEISRLARRTK